MHQPGLRAAQRKSCEHIASYCAASAVLSYSSRADTCDSESPLFNRRVFLLDTSPRIFETDAMLRIRHQELFCFCKLCGLEPKSVLQIACVHLPIILFLLFKMFFLFLMMYVFKSWQSCWIAGRESCLLVSLGWVAMGQKAHVVGFHI